MCNLSILLQNSRKSNSSPLQHKTEVLHTCLPGPTLCLRKPQLRGPLIPHSPVAPVSSLLALSLLVNWEETKTQNSLKFGYEKDYEL